MSPGTITRRRILIGAGSYADAKTALRLADAMADTLAEAIGGLMLEETHLTDLLGRRGQRVISPSGRLLPAPSPERLAALRESDERAFRAALAALGEARALHWTFARASGDLVAGLLGAATGWDILLFGHGNGQVAAHRRGRVVLIAPPGGVPGEAGSLAAALAALLDDELLTARQGPANTAGPRLPELPWQDLPDLLRRIARLSADAVVLDLSSGPLHRRDELRALVDAARCPVLVLGATPEPAPRGEDHPG